jgi:hypothetical protein
MKDLQIHGLQIFVKPSLSTDLSLLFNQQTPTSLLFELLKSLGLQKLSNSKKSIESQLVSSSPLRFMMARPGVRNAFHIASHGQRLY